MAALLEKYISGGELWEFTALTLSQFTLFAVIVAGVLISKLLPHYTFHLLPTPLPPPDHDELLSPWDHKSK